MGTFAASVEIGDLQGRRFQPLETLVDTGATYTRVPRTILEHLGVTPQERWPFRIADERRVEYEVGQAQVRIEGRTRYTVVVFGEPGSSGLLGAVTLEEFGLGVDPINRRLVPIPALLML